MSASDIAVSPSSALLFDATSITFVRGEAHVYDLALARALGFDRLRDIRKLIVRHEAALKELGEVCATMAQTSPRGGRPATEYHLNQEQAVYLCAKSDTAKATAITVEVVRTFVALRNERPEQARLSKTKAISLPAPSSGVDAWPAGRRDTAIVCMAMARDFLREGFQAEDPLLNSTLLDLVRRQVDSDDASDADRLRAISLYAGLDYDQKSRLGEFFTQKEGEGE